MSALLHAYLWMGLGFVIGTLTWYDMSFRRWLEWLRTYGDLWHDHS